MRKNKIYIDTGAWIALINSGDRFHNQAVSYYQQIKPIDKRITSSHVIAETYTWLRYRVGFSYASHFLSIVREACSVHSLIVIKDNETSLENAEQMLMDFPDQKLSYVDALSMAIMKNQGITTVFAFDHHFYLMNFELVPN